MKKAALIPLTLALIPLAALAGTRELRNDGFESGDTVAAQGALHQR